VTSGSIFVTRPAIFVTGSAAETNLIATRDASHNDKLDRAAVSPRMLELRAIAVFFRREFANIPFARIDLQPPMLDHVRALDLCPSWLLGDDLTYFLSISDVNYLIRQNVELYLFRARVLFTKNRVSCVSQPSTYGAGAWHMVAFADGSQRFALYETCANLICYCFRVGRRPSDHFSAPVDGASYGLGAMLFSRIARQLPLFFTIW